ncbi:MAG: hypothetical protein ACRC5R_05510 [Mycoplasmatales bacterium]
MTLCGFVKGNISNLPYISPGTQYIFFKLMEDPEGNPPFAVAYKNYLQAINDPNYNNHGFSMLAISEYNTGLVLAVDLREGKTHCAKGIDEMHEYIVNKLELNNRKVMFRSDSQFKNAGRI